MKKRVYLAVVVFVVVAVVAGVVLLPKRVPTALVRMHPFEETLELSAYVDAPTTVLASPAAAQIQSVWVAKGDAVAQGEPLFALEDTTARLALREAELTLQTQQAAYDAQLDALRAGEYATQSVSAWSQVQEVEHLPDDTALRAARLQVQYAREQLRQARLCSALDGVVIDLCARPGEMVAAGTPLAVVVDFSQAVLCAAISDDDAALLRSGMPAQLSGGMLGERQIAAVVARIEQSDATHSTTPALPQGTAQVVLEPQQGDVFLRLGASVQATVTLARYYSLAVPIDALAYDGQGSYVLAHRSGHAVRVDITTGYVADGYVQVTGDLLAGDRVLTEPGAVRAGARVIGDV